MTRDDVISALRGRADTLRARGVARLALIGSMARGTAPADSDVDLHVDVESGRRFSLVDHSGLRLLVCDLLNRDTDVLMRDALDARVLERLQRDAIIVF